MTKLELPDELKYLKRPRYEPAMRMDYQYIILEDVLPGLFYVTRFGRRRGRGEWAGRRARQVAEALSQKREKFAGFDGDREQRVLEEWLKVTVLRLIERGAADKVMSIRPLHFMTYRVDLPFNWAHLRSVPEFVSAILQHDPSAEPLATGTQEPFTLPEFAVARYSILKFFQVDSTGMLRMTLSARYFRDGVGSSRPS
jgi:hypothetical protein